MSEFHILSLSGGGYKGLFSSRVLSVLEEKFGFPIAQKFDLIAGTSIGGIIALALALEIPTAKIEDLFIKKGKYIFKKRCLFSNGYLFKSKYNNEGLKLVLTELFGTSKISDLKHRVIIPAVNYTEGRPQLFKTPHNPCLTKDKDNLLVDVALATSAAPIYFPIYSNNLGDFVDGGLVANHPGYFALIESEKYLYQKIEDIYQLHIGTISQMFTSSSSKWILQSSLASWRANIIKLIFSCQEQSADNLLKFILKDRYYSIDSYTAERQARNLALDKVSEKSSRILKQKAESAVQEFLGTEIFKKLKKHNAPNFNNRLE